MTEYQHGINDLPYKCYATGEEAERVWTDHSRSGVFNACEHCCRADDSAKGKSIAQSLSEINERRARANPSR